MTSVDSFDQLKIPETLSAQDRFFVTKVHEALADGIELERWCRDPRRQIQEFPIELKRDYALHNRAYAYFSSVPVNGQTKTVIGVRQEVEFGKIPGPNPEERLKQYVLSHFLPSAHWTYPSGAPGGFTLEQMLYCTADGQVGRYPQDQVKGVQ